MMTGDMPWSNPTVQIPSYDCYYTEIPAANNDALISTDGPDPFYEYDAESADVGYLEDYDVPVDAFSCDNFRMFGFKVKKCAVVRSHDWTECPFTHPGEKARRRDPRRFHYSGTPCPDFRNGGCSRGDACEYAHGVFECWLHPSRYRTQPCKDGTQCRRRVCFFAHTPEQLRVLPTASADELPSRVVHDSFSAGGQLFGSSPKSTLYSPVSPPVSPNSLSQLSGSMRRLQLGKMKMGMGQSVIQRAIMSLPSTPIRLHGRSGLGAFDGGEEEPVMERVESGRELRERIYAKLVKENSLKRLERVDSDSEAGLRFGWVDEFGN